MSLIVSHDINYYNKYLKYKNKYLYLQELINNKGIEGGTFLKWFKKKEPAQVAPSQVAPSQVAPSQVAPSQVAPSQVAPARAPAELFFNFFLKKKEGTNIKPKNMYTVTSKNELIGIYNAYIEGNLLYIYHEYYHFTIILYIGKHSTNIDTININILNIFMNFYIFNGHEQFARYKDELLYQITYNTYAFHNPILSDDDLYILFQKIFYFSQDIIKTEYKLLLKYDHNKKITLNDNRRSNLYYKTLLRRLIEKKPNIIKWVELEITNDGNRTFPELNPITIKAINDYLILEDNCFPVHVQYNNGPKISTYIKYKTSE